MPRIVDVTRNARHLLASSIRLWNTGDALEAARVLHHYIALGGGAHVTTNAGKSTALCPHH